MQDGYVGMPRLLTVIEIGSSALTDSAPLSVEVSGEGEALPRAAMAVAGQRLALYQDTPNGIQLQVHPLGGGQPSALSIERSQLQSEADGLSAARFDGGFALLPSEPGSTRAGAIIDWLREAGPAVTAELPADLPNLARLGERWLGWGAQRSALFHVGAAGTFELERELGRPFEGGRDGLGVHWDPGAQRVILPYIVDGSGIGSRPAAYALSLLDLSSPAPAWRSGLRTAGSPALTAYDRVGDARKELHFQRTDAGSFALTDTVDVYERHRLLEALDLERGQSEVIGFAERTLAASLTASGSARLLADYRGARAVSLGGADPDAAPAAHLALGFGNDRLERAGDGWLSYSLTYSNACYDGAPQPNDSVCLPSGTAALSQLATDPPRLVHETELPLADTFGTPPAAVREWLEIIAQGDEVGLLAHRDIRCRSEAECAALGVTPEVDEVGGRDLCDESDAECLARAPEVVRQVRGNVNQRWLHPYDTATGEFRPPLRLPDTDGNGWLSAAGLRAVDQPALVWVDPLEIAGDGYSLVRARIQLVRFPSLLGASPESRERITVPGFPMYALGGASGQRRTGERAQRLGRVRRRARAPARAARGQRLPAADAGAAERSRRPPVGRAAWLCAPDRR